MKITAFSVHDFEKNYLLKYNNGKHDLIMYDVPLNTSTAYLAKGCNAVSLSVADDASESVLELLKKNGIKYITLRSAGYDHVDVKYANSIGLKVSRVPDYSPYAIAEHSVALMLALNRKLIQADRKIHDLDFRIDDLIGFDMHEETVGIIGTGRIGSVTARILNGFGCRILAYDKDPDESLMKYYSVRYTSLNNLLSESRIITLHLPLTAETRYIIDAEAIGRMRKGVMLINTGRGPLVNTEAVVEGLKHGQIGAFGADVYEREKFLFFEDHSGEILQDELFARLLSFKNVLITGHQAFLTDTALRNIARVTIKNLDSYKLYGKSENDIITGAGIIQLKYHK